MVEHRNELSLESEFELQGLWWLPDREDHRCGGTLKYTPNSMELLVHGDLSGMTPDVAIEELSNVRSEARRFPLIHGHTDIGPCTLVRAEARRMRVSPQHFHQSIRSTYTANYLLFGDYVESHDIATTMATFNANCLNDFFSVRSFNVEPDYNGNHFQGATILYRRPPAVSFDVRSDNFKICFEQDPSLTTSNSVLNLSADFTVVLHPPTSQPFTNWHLPRIWQVCRLLTLLTDEKILPRHVNVMVEGASSECKLLWKAVWRPASEQMPSIPLFFYGHLAGKFGEILNAWFEASETLKNAIYLFSDGRLEGNSPEGRLLTLCQGFEALSRSQGDAMYMSVQEYEPIRRELTSHIPDVGDEHRDALSSKIRFGYEHSLRKRLRDAVNSLESATVTLVCRSVNNFVNGIVETRNYLTHYTDDLRRRALSGGDLVWASERLAMLLRILLLKRIGIDEKTIVERISGHPRLTQLWRMYYEHRECIGGQSTEAVTLSVDETPTPAEDAAISDAKPATVRPRYSLWLFSSGESRQAEFDGIEAKICDTAQANGRLAGGSAKTKEPKRHFRFSILMTWREEGRLMAAVETEEELPADWIGVEFQFNSQLGANKDFINGPATLLAWPVEADSVTSAEGQ